MVAPNVATSISCRDINLMNCSSQLMSSVVATSILCRNITSCLFRFDCHSFTTLFLSRPPSLVATSTFVATPRCYRDIIPLVYAQSSAAYLMIPVATCIKFTSCRDLVTGLCKPQNCNINQPAALISSLPFQLHFYFTNCCIFQLLFLLSFTLPANNKLVSFLIFLQINYPFLDENQAEKWTKNR